MSQRARISLSGTDPAMVDSVCNQIKGISQRTGVAIRGPVPLPTKKLKVACRKSPDGEGSETYDRWEMRIHKRLIDLDADERALRQLMRIQVPDGVNIEIVLRGARSQQTYSRFQPFVSAGVFPVQDYPHCAAIAPYAQFFHTNASCRPSIINRRYDRGLQCQT